MRFKRPTLAVIIAIGLFLTPAVSATSKYEVIYIFPGGSHGSGPNLFDALAIDAKGNLYGAAAGGTGTGCDGPCGVVFEMTPGANGKWRENVLFDFSVKTASPPQAARVVSGDSGTLRTLAKYEMRAHQHGRGRPRLHG